MVSRTPGSSSGPNAPELTLIVNRAKAASLHLTQDDIMKSIIAATNSSIAYNKTNFWIDPVNGMQYFVGVQFPEDAIKTRQDVLDIPITGPKQPTPIPLWNVAELKDTGFRRRSIMSTCSRPSI